MSTGPTRLPGLALAVLLTLLPSPAAASASGGKLALESRLFVEDPVDPAQARDSAALLLVPDWHATLGADANWEWQLTPYVRLDLHDARSRYFDLHEARLHYRDRQQLLAVGFAQVFWGVAESNHLVDIINQVDPRADVDLEYKLGQPLLGYTRFLDRYGRLELMWLPFFRPRPGMGSAARQRFVAAPATQSHGLGPLRRHDDWALRWSGQLGSCDVGLHHFAGLSREPDYRPDGSTLYRPIRQTGLDLQLAHGNMLWKLEALRREGQGQPFWAMVGGGEYTWAHPAGDLGLLMEWSRDQRDASAPPTRFARALFGGLRYRFNESGDSELLAGVLHDQNHSAWLYKVEFARRLAEQLRLHLVARAVDAAADSAYAALRHDANVQLTLEWNY